MVSRSKASIQIRSELMGYCEIWGSHKNFAGMGDHVVWKKFIDISEDVVRFNQITANPHCNGPRYNRFRI
jgi:hypothetical protein